MSHTLTVESALPETRMLFRSSMPDVRDWCPIRVCLQAPVSTSHTRMLVSSDPLTTWTPSNCWTCKTQTMLYSNPFTLGRVHGGVATVEECHCSLRAIIISSMLCTHPWTRPGTTCIYTAVPRTPVSLHFRSLTNQTFHSYRWHSSDKQRHLT